MQYPYHPNGRGFDEFYGFCSGHWGHYFSPMLEHNGQLVRGDGFVIDDFTTHAMEFIEREQRPAVLLLPALQHAPLADAGARPLLGRSSTDKELTDAAPRPDRRKTCPRPRAPWRCARTSIGTSAACSTKLDDLELADNTIVIYFSDNGPNGWRWNGGMKGRKGSTDEGGVRVPCFCSLAADISRQATRSRRSPGPSICCRRWPTWPASPLDSKKPLDGVSS